MVGVGVGVGVGAGGVGVDVGVGPITDTEADVVADADDVAFVVVFAVAVAEPAGSGDALLGAWLLLVDDVQPATNNEATKSNRTAIAVIGFNCIRICKRRRLA